MDIPDKSTLNLHFLARDSKHIKIVESLIKEPKTVNELANELNMDSDSCRYYLNRLKSKGIVECINPEVRQGKIFAASEDGEEMIEILKIRRGGVLY